MYTIAGFSSPTLFNSLEPSIDHAYGIYSLIYNASIRPDYQQIPFLDSFQRNIRKVGLPIGTRYGIASATLKKLVGIRFVAIVEPRFIPFF